MAKRKCREFEDVVRQIARSEDDVDKVLKAARLQRTERRWDTESFLWAVAGVLAVTAGVSIPVIMVLTILFD